MKITLFIAAFLSISQKTNATSHNHSEETEIARHRGLKCTKEIGCGWSMFLECRQNVCKHKRSWPLEPIEIVGTGVLTVLMALSVMSGIGGGGIIVPLLIAFYQFGTKQAIAISGFTILLGSITRYFITLKERHPDKDATAIEYALSNVMLPTVLTGSITGVLFAQLFPDIVLQILLTVLLVFLTIQSGFKARSIYKKETLQKQQDKEGDGAKFLGQSTDSSSRTNLYQKINISLYESQRTGDGSNAKPIEQQQQEIVEMRKLLAVYESERFHTQWKKQFINILTFLALFFVTCFRGSRSNPSVFGVEVCSWEDWSSMSVYSLFCLAISFYSLRQAQWEQNLKKKYGDGIGKSEVLLEGRALTKLLCFSFLGGWVSGALGLGGGSIFNPLLLSLGCPPKVASSTGMYMIIFSTGASTTAYMINGLLDPTYGGWIGGWCVVGTVLGMILLNTIVKKLGRQSPLVMLLCLIMGSSAIAVPYFGLQDLPDNMWQLGSIC